MASRFECKSIYFIWNAGQAKLTGVESDFN